MLIDAETCDVASYFFEILTRAQHGAVFDRARDQMLAARFKLHRGIDHGIIGFSAAASKNNFCRFTAEQRSEAFPRKIYRLSSRGREAVSTRRISVIFRQKRQHFLDHRGIELCRSVVIQIDDFALSHCRHCNGSNVRATTLMGLSLLHYSTTPLFNDFDLGAGEPATARDHGLSTGKADPGNGPRTWPRSQRNHQAGFERESAGPVSQGNGGNEACIGKGPPLSRRRRILPLQRGRSETRPRSRERDPW